MKRGFISRQYASGGTLASSQAGDAPAMSDVFARLQLESKHEKEQEALAEKRRFAPPALPDRTIVTAELLRRLQANGGNTVLSIIPIRDGLASVILWLDVPSKLRFTSQLAPSLAAFEPHFVNRLSTRSSLAGGTISVADRAIQAGDLVLVEFPLISMPGAWPEHDNVVKLEVTLQTAVGALPAELQATYKALANTWDGYTGPDHRAQGELTGILNTNAYTLHGLPGDDIIHYCGVFAALSRINHRPNARPHWDPESATISLRALRPIAAKEEVTISYLVFADLLAPTATRRAILQDGYRFVCSCPACTDSAGSDARRAEIVRTPLARRSEFLRWAGCAADGDEMLLIDKSKKVCELYEREQLLEPFGADEHGWTHAVQLMNCYLALGKEREAKFWAKKIAAGAMAMQQVLLWCARDAAMVLRDPKSAPAWDMRRKAKAMMANP